jgi:hypothetical protein
LICYNGKLLAFCKTIEPLYICRLQGVKSLSAGS